jgi:hypothetical protein
MTVDLDKLEQLARATTPGPWEARHLGYGHSHEVVRLPSGAPDDGGDIVATMWEKRDAAFIAAANPAAVLELVQRLRAAEVPLIAMGADERVEAVDLIPGWYQDADPRPLGRMTMRAPGPLSAGADVVAMDARRAELLEGIVRDLAAADPCDRIEPCFSCGALPDQEHAADCVHRRAVEATRP